MVYWASGLEGSNGVVDLTDHSNAIEPGAYGPKEDRVSGTRLDQRLVSR